MKKGFTLAELLGVITLLAIICLIAFPPILNSIKKSKQNVDNSSKELIYNACKRYIDSNDITFTDNKYCVKIQTLIDSGELMPGIIDSNTNNEIDKEKYVKVTNEYNQYQYSIVSEGC